jgi:hypothetical protein
MDILLHHIGVRLWFTMIALSGRIFDAGAKVFVCFTCSVEASRVKPGPVLSGNGRSGTLVPSVHFSGSGRPF